MDYSQLAQAKAEKRYPPCDEDSFENHNRAIGYEAALNDVKGLYDAGKELIRLKDIKDFQQDDIEAMMDYVENKAKAWETMRAAIEKFEKIEP